MTRFLRATKNRVLIGVRLNVNGTSANIVLPISRVRGQMQAPVEFQGAPASLYFEHLRRKAGLNWVATDLFGRHGFFIYGPATVMVRIETWHSIRVLGTECQVQAAIAHLNVGEHAVVPTSRRDKHQDVIAKGETDILLLRMAL